jgi:hypothetical protein
MARGKPFVCWIGKGNSTALLIGDEVGLRLDSGEIVRGKFGCYRRKVIFPYFVKVGSTRHQAGLIFNLIPIQEIPDDI